MLILFIFLSPAFVAIIELVIMTNIRRAGITKPSQFSLLMYSVFFAFIGAAVSLLFTIVSMVRYEATTGYCAGNGPLAWIIVYGPLSAALGQTIALVWWYSKVKKFKKPEPAYSDGTESTGRTSSN